MTRVSLSGGSPVAHPSTERREGVPVVVSGCRVLGRALARVVLGLHVTGTEHVPASGPVVLAGNHSGILDGPLLYFFCPRPTVVLAKSEMFVGRWTTVLAWLGLVPVRRGRPDRAAMQRGLAVLSRGGVLCVFPEGTRGTGDLSTVSDGAGWFALRTGASVVPVAVTGTSYALPRGRAVPRLRAPVTVAFGPPLTVHADGDPRSRSTVRAASEQLRRGLVEHLRSSAEAAR